MSGEKRQIYLVSSEDAYSDKEGNGRKVTKLVFRTIDKSSLVKDGLYVHHLNKVNPVTGQGSETSILRPLQQQLPQKCTTINIHRFKASVKRQIELSSEKNFDLRSIGDTKEEKLLNNVPKPKIKVESGKTSTLCKSSQKESDQIKTSKTEIRTKKKGNSKIRKQLETSRKQTGSSPISDFQQMTKQSEEELIEEKVKIEEARLLAENVRLSKLLNELKIKEEKLSKIKTYQKERITLTKLKQNQEMLYFYLGMKNVEVIDSMVLKLSDYFSSNESKYESSLHLEDQLTMTLMKLRRNYCMHDLAFRFRINVSEADRVVFNIIIVLHDIFYEKELKGKPFLSESTDKDLLPEQFYSFPNCRIVLECVKVGCEDPDNDSETEIFTSSKFDSKITLKGLLGISPSKSVLFASSLYEESASNTDIFRDCGINDKLYSGDLILADKSFNVQNIVPKNVLVNVPLECQLEEKQIKNLNSKARAFIGRTTMQHIRRFCILNRIPIFLNSIMSSVFQLCASLVNLQPTIHHIKNELVE